ncbi:MAG: hypothetical protein QF927_02420 [Verrucomicrobiota bacterium]|nr:hypothetical protein [Verrucomicrobiota bacterium]
MPRLAKHNPPAERLGHRSMDGKRPPGQALGLAVSDVGRQIFKR